MTEDAGKFDPEQATFAFPGQRGIEPKRPVAAVWGQEAALETVASKAASDTTLSAASASASAQVGRLVTSKPEWLTEGISMEEVSKHNDEKSAWIVVKGRVTIARPTWKATQAVPPASCSWRDRRPQRIVRPCIRRRLGISWRTSTSAP